MTERKRIKGVFNSGDILIAPDDFNFVKIENDRLKIIKKGDMFVFLEYCDKYYEVIKGSYITANVLHNGVKCVAIIYSNPDLYNIDEKYQDINGKRDA